MRNEIGVALILLAGVVSFGGAFALSQPAEAPSSASPLIGDTGKTYYTVVPAVDRPVVKTEAATSEPAAPAGPPPFFNTQTSSIASLMANPEARAVVFQDLPALSNVSGSQIAMVGEMSLRTVQSMLPAMLTDAALKKLDADLAKVPAPAASPLSAPAAPVVAAATAEAASPTSQTQTAALSSRSTLSSLLGDAGARAILMREIPTLAQAPQAQLELAANMSLRDIQRLMPGAVTDAALQRVDQGLSALAPATPPAPGV